MLKHCWNMTLFIINKENWLPWRPSQKTNICVWPHTLDNISTGRKILGNPNTYSSAHKVLILVSLRPPSLDGLNLPFKKPELIQRNIPHIQQGQRLRQLHQNRWIWERSWQLPTGRTVPHSEDITTSPWRTETTALLLVLQCWGANNFVSYFILS